jgi:superfamily II DNA or RNA helicase
LIARGRSPIVLTERREHRERLAARLRSHIPSLVILHGEMRPAERRAALNELRSNGGGDERVILATGRYIGEGFDDPRLDTLLLVMPIAWKGTIVQYAGRLHRAHRAKRDALVYDYVDAELPVLRRMFAKRLKAYKSLGYEVDNPESHQGDEPSCSVTRRGRSLLASERPVASSTRAAQTLQPSCRPGDR